MSVGVFFLGLAVGILANQVFAMLTRALPQQWVRFAVRIGHPEADLGLSGSAVWTVPVKISSPVWYRRMLMSTLAEYLTVEVRLDGDKWFKTQWDKGDNAEYRLLADGVMTIGAIILSESSGLYYLTYRCFESDYIVKPQSKQISIRVVRSLDDKIADMMRIPIFFQSNGKIAFGLETHVHSPKYLELEDSNGTARFSEDNI